MSTYKSNLPLLQNQQFITDGGLETTLIFDQDFELPEFAAFPLLYKSEEKKVLRDYYLSYINVAKKNRFGFILESPTYRASKSWGDKLGYTDDEINEVNRKAIALLAGLRRDFEDRNTPMIISGCLGPQGDGYHIDGKMSVAEAKKYHSGQIKAFKQTEADIVSAYTLNYVEEAIGIARAAQDADIPVVISFTVETDGRLPSGQPLGEAISLVDEATGFSPLYYMINCAHPTHFNHVLQGGSSWLERIKAIRANSSCKSHAELDESVEIDRGDRTELKNEYINLLNLLPNLSIFGGCCGTDHHHIEEICSGLTGLH